MTDATESTGEPAAKQREINANEIPFATDGLTTPTIYADFIRGTMISAGIAKLNLVESRVNALTDEVQAVHVATRILPVAQLKAWETIF